NLKPEDAIGLFQSLIASVPQQPCGLFEAGNGCPDLTFSARLCAGLSSLLLAERAFPAVPPGQGRSRGNTSNTSHSSYPSVAPALGRLRDPAQGWPLP